jgi:hypothetical protein
VVKNTAVNIKITVATILNLVYLNV